MSQDSLGSIAKKLVSTSALIAGASATLISAGLGKDFTASGIGEKLLLFGAPTVVGYSIAVLISTESMKVSDGGHEDSPLGMILTGLVCGAATTAFLSMIKQVGVGRSAMLSTAAITGGSAIVGEFLGNEIHRM